MKNFFKFILIILLLLIIPLTYVIADEIDSNIGEATSEGVKLDSPLRTGDANKTPITPNQLIGNIIQAIIGVVGSLTLLMFVYGGLVWMSAAGNMERVKKGKDILTWATVGLVIIFTSFAVVRYIFISIAS